MYFCPDCKEIFSDPGICPRCHKKLVPKLSPEQFASPLVEIFSVRYPSYAELIKELLEKEGIYCVLQGKEWAGAFGGILPDSLGIRVLVPECKTEQAKQLIDAYVGEVNISAHTRICPECGKQINPFELTCPFCKKSVIK